MNIEDYIHDAIAMVDSWGLPEEDFTQAVNDQTRLMCGMNLEPPVTYRSPPLTQPCVSKNQP